MYIAELTSRESVDWERANRDIPELFSIEGGTGYGYVSQGTNRDFISGNLERAGSDGFSNCAALILQSAWGARVAHITPQMEGLPSGMLSSYESAVVVSGTRAGSKSFTSPSLLGALRMQGLEAEAHVIEVANQDRSFGIMFDLRSNTLGTICRDGQQPTISRYRLVALNRSSPL